MSTSRNVLITGGNKGIGLAATQKFIHAGHKVYALARDFADFPFKDHPQVEMVKYDLSNISGIPDLVAEAMFWLATDCPEYINGTCIDINNEAFPR
ncbi:MAG: SDR family NAD(P)-dependent oxidoreductase [Candidatus Electrothrix sp. GM3_4]|nr:SDR family NAD(P)-dependent oxidoreductase [Candidatus Electrothrix sp. GM3_4]